MHVLSQCFDIPVRPSCFWRLRKIIPHPSTGDSEGTRRVGPARNRTPCRGMMRPVLPPRIKVIPQRWVRPGCGLFLSTRSCGLELFDPAGRRVRAWSLPAEAGQHESNGMDSTKGSLGGKRRVPRPDPSRTRVSDPNRRRVPDPAVRAFGMRRPACVVLRTGAGLSGAGMSRAGIGGLAAMDCRRTQAPHREAP